MRHKMRTLFVGCLVVLALTPSAASAQDPAMSVADDPDPIRLAEAAASAPATFNVTIHNPSGAPFKSAKLGPVGNASFANSFTSATASQGTCSTAIQAGCELGTIAPGATVTAKFVWAANGPATTATTRWLLDEGEDPRRRIEVTVDTTIIVGPPVISDVARSGKASSGFVVAFQISEAAQLVVWLERKLSGRRKAGKCSTKARTGRRCSFYKPVKTLAATPVGSGANSVPVAAKDTRRLSAGAYRIRMQAAAGDGAKSNVASAGTFSGKRSGGR